MSDVIRLTAQQFFDTTITHLFNQRRQAVNASGTCMYRNADGESCAIGVHIPDGHPSLDHEGGWYSLTGMWPDIEDIFPVADDGVVDGEVLDGMASTLQDIHDSDANWSSFKSTVFSSKGLQCLRSYAKNFKLDLTLLEQLIKDKNIIEVK